MAIVSSKRGAGGPYYGVDAHAGLHVLKDKWKQKSFLFQQCEELARTLDAAIAATTRAAPSRKREQLHFNHRHTRLSVEEMGHSKSHPGVIRDSDERKLEDALLSAFCTDATSIPGLWTRIVAKQYALFAEQEKGGWGYIDLLGVSNNQPVVIELKKATSTEPPLRPLIEAASYAIALKKNWASFADAFAAVHGTVSTAEDPIPLVVIAPRSYWDSWSGQQPWNAPYRTLVDALAAHGYPAKFASIRAKLRDRVYAPESVQVEEIAFP